jgi:hypothetical protein
VASGLNIAMGKLTIYWNIFAAFRRMIVLYLSRLTAYLVGHLLIYLAGCLGIFVRIFMMHLLGVFFLYLSGCFDRLCGLVVRVLGYRSGGPGSIPGTTRKKSSGSGTGSTKPREYN